jgi:integrase
MVAGKSLQKPSGTEFTEGTGIDAGADWFLSHVEVHSPDKPRTLARYRIVLDHFKRLLGKLAYVEAVERRHIDEYKAARSKESDAGRSGGPVQPSTINFEVSVLRTFFNFLIHERSVKMENPCARFKPLRDPSSKANASTPTYSQKELDLLVAVAEGADRLAFLTLLLTGLREQELCFLTWEDVNLQPGRECLLVRRKAGFSPKDYEEREIPIPAELANLLRNSKAAASWVFPSTKGNLETHLLRRLKRVAKLAGVEDATLHKFRHTYATRLLEGGADIVTVQRLMGHVSPATTGLYDRRDEQTRIRAVRALKFPY